MDELIVEAHGHHHCAAADAGDDIGNADGNTLQDQFYHFYLRRGVFFLLIILLYRKCMLA